MKLNKYLLKSFLLRPMIPLQTTTCNALVAKEAIFNTKKTCKALKLLLEVFIDSKESIRKKEAEKHFHVETCFQLLKFDHFKEAS